MSNYLIHGISFPRSGRTWVRFMLASVYSEKAGCDRKVFLQSRARFEAPGYPTIKWRHCHRFLDYCTTHVFPADHYRDSDVLFIARDPRDVLVSHFYHKKWDQQKWGGDLDHFVHYSCRAANPVRGQANAGLEMMVRYLNDWVSHAPSFKSFSMVHYEDLVADTKSQLSGLLEKIGVQVERDVIERAVRFAQFENMHQLEKATPEEYFLLNGGENPSQFKVRSGKVGSHREELSAATLDYVNLYLDQHLHDAFSRYKV